jgi:ABC-2 type transport system ATP-binding protein
MTNAEFAIQTEGLTRQFGRARGVESLTFAVPRGSVCALLGRKGAGKTTTVRLIRGLLRPTTGSSTVLGHDSSRLPPPVRRRIGYVDATLPLHEWMTVAHEGYFVSRLHDTWDNALFTEIIGRFALRPDDRIRTLSPDQRAVLSLAITAATEPELLILDVPSGALDSAVRRDLLAAMVELLRASGRTILFSSSALEDVERLANYVVVLQKGTVSTAGSAAELPATVRNYRVAFTAGNAPATLPPIRGMSSSRRVGDAWMLEVISPADDTYSALASLGGFAVRESPVAFTTAMLAYMGPANSSRPLLNDEEAAT